MSLSGHGLNGLHGGAVAGAAGAGGWGVHHGLDNHDGGGISRHFGNGLGTSSDPLHLIFGNIPTAPAAHNWQYIALPSGLMVSLVALVAVTCLAIVLASALVKTVVVVKCSQ